ncbi:MAG: HAMP domain-containing sensor histidine kinase, partial [Gammaproteobacteria bacterium]
LGDTMGAYVIDVPASAFFKSLRKETGLLAAAVLFFGLVGGGILMQQQHRFSSVQARMQRESERGAILSEAREKAQNEARSLSAQLIKTNENLETALTKEKDLNELQRQFVSMASHELRTPLAIIDGSAQFLAYEAENITTDYLLSKTGRIRGAVKRMTQLMESTLSAARIQDGHIEIEINPCDIGNIVREVCERQQEIANKHSIACNLAKLPDTILADASSVEQMLANLLSNAVKYAPNAPEIAVVALRMGSCVVIAVRDRGIGIDEDDLGRIGERFFRARTSTGIAGTGIGLALTKVLIDMHGGSLNIESKKGEGSTFTISLPIAGPDLSQQADANVA